MTEATDRGYGSEGLCPHCKHFDVCPGSTKPPDGFMTSSSRQSCGGGDTFFPAGSTGDTNLDIEYGLVTTHIDFGCKFEEG